MSNFRQKRIGKKCETPQSGEITESFIKNPNSYQKSLYSIFSRGNMTKTEYIRELDRYDDFLTKPSISYYDSILHNIEFKELFSFLGEIS